MSKKGPLIIIDDDPDDHEMIQRILAKLNLENEIKRFFNGEEALQYFMSTTDKPFLILCDINMPLINGIELRRNIESMEALRGKITPFVFLTTAANPEQIAKAYNMKVQGFFIKGHTYDDLKKALTQIISYWRLGEHPL